MGREYPASARGAELTAREAFASSRAWLQVNLAVRMGKARAPIHHGEIVQGAFRVDGRVMRGLVTLPCPLYRSRATFARDISGRVRVLPDGTIEIDLTGPAAEKVEKAVELEREIVL